MDKKSGVKILLVDNKVNELTRVAVYLEELGEEWGLSAPLIMSLNLVLEEALSNIILYGFDAGSKNTIEITFRKTGYELNFSIVDDGYEYDPTQKADPDVTLPVEDRPIGGLGIFLIKKIMDKVEYQRKDDKNYLILTKILNHECTS
jgi:serine/threonine-protein kinase RsbW